MVTKKQISQAATEIKSWVDTDALWVQMAHRQGKEYLAARAQEELAAGNVIKATVFLLLAAVE